MRLALLGVVFAVTATHSVTANELDEELEAARLRNVTAETNTLQSCDRGDCPVFYVDALGGAFPIPLRFFVLAPSHVAKTQSFNSSVSIILKGGMTRENLLNGLSGSIEIGPRARIEPMLTGKYWEITRTETRGDVRLLSLNPKPPMRLPTGYEALHIVLTKNEYVRILDQNPNLTELLMRIYERDSRRLGSTDVRCEFVPAVQQDGENSDSQVTRVCTFGE